MVKLTDLKFDRIGRLCECLQCGRNGLSGIKKIVKYFLTNKKKICLPWRRSFCLAVDDVNCLLPELQTVDPGRTGVTLDLVAHGRQFDVEGQ
jgi:hypothetical protein